MKVDVESHRNRWTKSYNSHAIVLFSYNVWDPKFIQKAKKMRNLVFYPRKRKKQLHQEISEIEKLYHIASVQPIFQIRELIFDVKMKYNKIDLVMKGIERQLNKIVIFKRKLNFLNNLKSIEHP